MPSLYKLDIVLWNQAINLLIILQANNKYLYFMSNILYYHRMMERNGAKCNRKMQFCWLVNIIKAIRDHSNKDTKVFNENFWILFICLYQSVFKRETKIVNRSVSNDNVLHKKIMCKLFWEKKMRLKILFIY